MIEVNLPNHHYKIEVQRGLLKSCGQWVANIWRPQRVAIITDETVAELYGEDVADNLVDHGFDVTMLVVPPGEESKSLEKATLLYDALADNGFTRSDGVIALGGGVIGDLAGFVASTYMRGLHFLQIPTTLLAQVDSSIGGKTAVNTKKAKNLVGTFAQPDGVLIDPNVLKTLEMRRVREGIAEIIKSAAIADKQLWDYLGTLKNEEDLLNHAKEVIHASLEVKRHVVEEDEFDTGKRQLLNLGHTFGHAIEQKSHFQMTHGHAVAIGMHLIAKAAEAKGIAEKGTAAAIAKALEQNQLPKETEFSPAEVAEGTLRDKKRWGGTISFVFPKKIGACEIVKIPVEEVEALARTAMES